jgi:hypothetical protein
VPGKNLNLLSVAEMRALLIACKGQVQRACAPSGRVFGTPAFLTRTDATCVFGGCLRWVQAKTGRGEMMHELQNIICQNLPFRIIGITGLSGAGKGTVVEYLQQQGFAHHSGAHHPQRTARMHRRLVGLVGGSACQELGHD